MLNYFLFILEKYMIISKFIKSGHQPPWRTAAAGLTAMGDGGWEPRL
jgi:hypothetical protein